MKIYKAYSINGESNNAVAITRLFGSFVKTVSTQTFQTEDEGMVEKVVWQGVGCFNKNNSRYFGIFKYVDRPVASFLQGVIGIHIGTNKGNTIRIFGMNLSGCIGIFNCNWIKWS